MTAGHPIIVRRAEPGDAEAIHQTFLGPRAIAGTLQLPYPSVEMWRRRLAEFPTDDCLLVATIDTEVVGNLGLLAASKSPRRRHVAHLGMAVRDDRQRRGVGTALLQPGGPAPVSQVRVCHRGHMPRLCVSRWAFRGCLRDGAAAPGVSDENGVRAR